MGLDNSTAAMREPSRFEQWQSRMENVRAQVTHCAIMVDKFTDELVGSSPSEVAGKSPNPENVQTHTDMMDNQLMLLEGTVARLQYVADRLWDSGMMHKPGILDEDRPNRVEG